MVYFKPIKSQFKYRYPFVYFIILSIPVFLISITGLEQLFKLNQNNVLLSVFQKIFFILLPLIIAVHKLISLKSIIIKNEKIIVHYPFIFKSKEYLFSRLKDVKIEKIKPEGNGPSFIEFPYKKVTLIFKNKSISINSKTNKNIEEFISFFSTIKII